MTWGDAHLDQIGEGASDMLSYLRKHAPRFPDGIRCDDLPDVAVLLVWQDQAAADRECFWFDQVVSLKAHRASFAAPFGIASPAGFNNRRSRLHERLDATGSGRPDEKAETRRRAALAQPAGEWVDRARERVMDVARELVERFYMLVDEETAEEIIEVRRELRAGAYGEGAVGLVDAAVQALAVCEVDGVAEQAAPLVQRWAALMLERKLAGATA